MALIYGTSGNDVLDGTIGDDEIYGFEGNDMIRGGSGKDEIYGGTGNDTYFINDVFDFIFDEG
jgi:Ca2+-binding RTX toxin-like protein